MSTKPEHFAALVLAPPADGADPVAHYAAELGGGALLVVPDGASEGVTLTLNGVTNPSLYAPYPGDVSYVPEGEFVVKGSTLLASGAGALVLRLSPNAYIGLREQTLGLPSPTHVCVQNVDLDAVRAHCKAFLEGLPEDELAQELALRGVERDEDKELAEQLIERIDVGEAIFVDRGAKIAEFSDATEHTVHYLNTVGDELSPVPYIKALRALGGERWEQHPLLEQIRQFATTIDIYLRFRTWYAGAYVPLPDGTDVALVVDGG